MGFMASFRMGHRLIGKSPIRLLPPIKNNAVFLCIPLIAALDLLTKWWATGLFAGVKSLIPGFLEIQVVFNRGFLFGWLDGEGTRPALLISAIMLSALAGLVFLTSRIDEKKSMRRLGIACMIGGALGNLSDRLLHGHVVDFIVIWRFPILNLADLALLTGLLLIAGDLTIHRNRN